jgi:ABC-type lipoprotein release transport system permease subunit
MTLTFLNLVVVNGILVGLLTGSYKQFREFYSGDVYITPARRREEIEASQQIINRLKADSGVQALTARLSAQAQIQADLANNTPNRLKPNQTGGNIIGIDPESEESVTNFSRLVLNGQPLKTAEEGYILIGANRLQQYSSFADVDIPGLELLRGVEVGSKVRVTFNTETPEGEKLEVSKDMVVKGIVKSKVDQVSQSFFMLDTELRKLLRSSELNVQEIAVKTKEGRAEDVLALTRSFTDPQKVRVQSSEEAIPSFLRDIEQTFDIIGNVIGGISLVVASITVFIVIFINAVTRRKFIGILKGIGVKASAIELAYIFQALFYGFIGSALGSALVFGFLKPYIDQNPLDFPFSDGILDASVEGSLARAAILLLITLIAGYLPARMIVKRNTLDSILGR